MAKFTKLGLARIIKDSKTGEVVEIFKYKKNDSGRAYWALEVNGKQLSSQMYSAKWLAEKRASDFLNRNNDN